MNERLQFVDRPVRVDCVSEERAMLARMAAGYPDLRQLLEHVRRRPFASLDEDEILHIVSRVRPEWFHQPQHKESAPMVETLSFAECQQRIDARLKHLESHPTRLHLDWRPTDRAEYDARCAADSELHALYRALYPKPAPRVAAPPPLPFAASTLTEPARRVLAEVEESLRITRPSKLRDPETRRSAAQFVAQALKLTLTETELETIATAHNGGAR